jgi:hypothetical protein
MPDQPLGGGAGRPPSVGGAGKPPIDNHTASPPRQGTPGVPPGMNMNMTYGTPDPAPFGARPEIYRLPEAITVRGPVSIYLTDEGIHGEVESVVEAWLATADGFIGERDEPVIGSWFRRMVVYFKVRAPKPDSLAYRSARETLFTAVHAADSRLIQAQDAYVTATLLQNVGPVLQALQPTRDAVVRAGALLIVKVDWVVQVYQLTAVQQVLLDHRPELAASPTEIIAALRLHEADSQESPDKTDAGEAVLPSERRQVGSGRGETAAATGN